MKDKAKECKRIKEYQKRKKKMAVDRMGGKCVICGYNKCISALEFHHMDKSKKEFHPSYIIGHWKFERIIDELDKCLLLCANCHRETHDEESGVDLIHLQNKVKRFVENECKSCHIKFKTKQYSQVYCSDGCRYIGSRKTLHPSKSDLSKLIERKTSWTQMGKIFGVSGNAVKKWAKKYNIEFTTNAYNKTQFNE